MKNNIIKLCIAAAAAAALTSPYTFAEGFEFDVDASNSRFSDEYEPYYPMITAAQKTTEQIYNETAPTKYELTPLQKQTRMAVIDMYRKAGFDISWGVNNIGDTSRFEADKPGTWSTKTPKPLEGNYEQCFSIDACWNNKIPMDFPKVELPREVFSWGNFMFGTIGSAKKQGGNGTGIPVIVGKSTDSKKTFADKESADSQIRKLYSFRAPDDFADYLNTNTSSDQHAIFIDDEIKMGIHTWQSWAANTWVPYGFGGTLPDYDLRCRCASNIFRLDGIGADGRAGVYAVQVPALGFTVKPWDLQNPDEEIPHAIAGAVNPLFSGRIYPATISDAGAPDASDGNVGALVEGGVVRLDPEIDLKSLLDKGKLSVPCYKLLKCIQDYGFYNLDKCSNSAQHGVLIYTSTSPSDWRNSSDSRYNVPYKNGTQGIDSVTAEFEAFFNNDEFFGLEEAPKLYATIPNVKYAKLDINGDGVIDRNDEKLVKENMDKPVNDTNKACDVNCDGKITGRDAEIYYNYFNDKGQHSFIYYNVNVEECDKDMGSVIVAADYIGRKNENTTQVKEGAETSIAAIPKPGYEFDCWTDDFEGITEQAVQVKMDKDYNVGAKFKKKETYSFTVTAEGGGKVECCIDGKNYGEPEKEYGKNTLVKLRAVPDDGYTFIGWEGSIEGISNTAEYVVTDNTNIKAIFTNSGYTEKYNADDWEAVNIKTDVSFDEKSKRINFGFANFQKSSMIFNKSIRFDDGYTFYVRIDNSIPLLGDGNGGKIIFDYTDSKNYYYISIMGGGKITMGKVYNGITSTIRSYVKERKSNGVAFDRYPIDIKVTRTKEGRITVDGFKNNAKLTYFDNIKETTFSGGMIGVGSVNHGFLNFSNIAVIPAEENN